jgi:hypothetical protein
LFIRSLVQPGWEARPTDSVARFLNMSQNHISPFLNSCAYFPLAEVIPTVHELPL